MNDTIISKTNEKVKYIKSLNEKKFRQKNKAFYLEGIKVVNEVLKSNKAINILFIAYSEDILFNIKNGKEQLEQIKKLKNEYQVLSFSKDIFQYVTDTKTPQGILVVMKMEELDLEDYNFQEGNLLVLDRIQDSGNLGTIIRTADAFNVKTIVCIKGTTDVYSQKVLRSTMGSILRVDVLYSDLENLELIKKIKKSDFLVVSTTLNTNESPKDLDYKNKKYAFILGNEANGIDSELIDLSDKKIKIPMSDNTESLNVGIASGIILYEQYKNIF